MNDLEERLNKRIDYLSEMAEKYYQLNSKTHNKYLWRAEAINDEIEALVNLKADITNEWDKIYEEDLQESGI